MIVKLTTDEIRDILAEALMKKIKYSGDKIDSEMCWFEVRSNGEEIDDIEYVHFVWDEENG